MSEQNPSGAAAPQQPSGSASGGTQSFGSAPGGRETFGSAPSGIESFGQAPPPAPPAPPSPPAPPAPPVGPAAPRKRKGLVAGILTAVAVVVVACVAVLFAGARLLNKDAAANAQVGQCLTDAVAGNADDVKIVDCSSPEAAFTVVSRYEGKTNAEASSLCTDPSVSHAYWSGRDESGPGTVLCLAPAKK